MTQVPAPLLPAATVLVIRAAAASDDIEVLLVRRSHRASFMANAYVFPGGRVDAADAVAPPGTHAAEAVDTLMAMRRAAARELGEEVGLQVGDVMQLVPFAHWVTPSAEPKRFDTAFFLWPLGPADEVKVDSSEVFDPLWITPTAALARYAEGGLNLPPPTACTLEDLAAELTAARTHEAAARTKSAHQTLLQSLLTRCAGRRPLPVLPKFFADGEGTLSIVMPWDAAYAELPGEGEPVPALAAGGAPVLRRIRRCQLRPLGLAAQPNLGANYATATASAPVSAAPRSDGNAVHWTVERMES